MLAECDGCQATVDGHVEARWGDNDPEIPFSITYTCLRCPRCSSPIVMGTSDESGQDETYRGSEYRINLLRKVALEIAVNDDFVEKTIDCLRQVARTGSEGTIGDGKIFVLPMEEAVQVSDGSRGPGAI